MAIGTSGRIVIEIDRAIKEQLYQSLGDDGLSLKQWFLDNASTYLSRKKQPELPFVLIETCPKGNRT